MAEAGSLEAPTGQKKACACVAPIAERSSRILTDDAASPESAPSNDALLHPSPSFTNLRNCPFPRFRSKESTLSTPPGQIDFMRNASPPAPASPRSAASATYIAVSPSTDAYTPSFAAVSLPSPTIHFLSPSCTVTFTSGASSP